jgi:hypothetical protein
MNVSAADIIALHIAVFGERAPDTTPFVQMALRIRDARPGDWQDLFKHAEALRAKHPLGAYEAVAADLQHHLGA